MKSWRVICVLTVCLLFAGTVSVDASIPPARPATEPWTTEYVDRRNDEVGTHMAIAHHPTTGRVYISFYDPVNRNLMLAQEVTPGTGNCVGNTNWKCQVIDHVDSVGKYTSIDVISVPGPGMLPPSTLIGISYYDETNRALKVATYATYPLPSSWTIHTVDDSISDYDFDGTYTSIKFSEIDLVPIIGYHSYSEYNQFGSVRVARWVGADGNCGDHKWWCETVDNDSNPAYGSHVSLDVDNGGKVYLAFYDPIESSVRLASYVGSGGTCKNVKYNCMTIDSLNDTGKYVSLHAPDSTADVIRMAYYDVTVGKIKYAEKVGSNGHYCASSAYDCYTVDEVGIPLGNFDLALDMDAQGYPIIAYMHALGAGPKKLNLARLAEAYGEEIGNCGDTRLGDLYQYWQCNTIDGGNSNRQEAEFVAVSVSPAGLATIAYSEYNSYDDETYLKVAQQHFTTHLPLVRR